MKIKSILYIWFITFSAFVMNGENFSKHEFIKVKTIPAGKEEGLIGWNEKNIEGGGYPGPVTFTISKNNVIYIPDRINARINLYDLRLNFVRTIIDKEKESHFAFSMKVDEDDNIISVLIGKGMKKIDNNGNKLFFVSYKNLPEETMYIYNYFPIENKIYFYNDSADLEIINESGSILKNDQALGVLKDVSRKLTASDNSLAVSNHSQGQGPELMIEKDRQIKNYQDNAKHILIGDKLFTTNFKKMKEYNENMKEINSALVEAGLSKGTKPQPDKQIDLEIKKYSFGLIGYDNDHNSYWQLTERKTVKHIRMQAIAVYSRYGELLDAFYYGQIFHYENNNELYETTGSHVAVAPNGDIYFMLGHKKGHTFWKVERQW